MDSDDIFYGIKSWYHDVDADVNFNQPMFTVNKIFHEFLMGTLELKPAHAANSVSVDGPIRVNNVDHHVRVTSEVITPIQAEISDPEDRGEQHGPLFQEGLSICGQQRHCREICDNNDGDDGDEGEDDGEDDIHEDEVENCEEEDEDEEECIEEDEEDEEDCDDEEENEEEDDDDDDDDDDVDDELCISITDSRISERPCRDPPQIKSEKSCNNRGQQHCRDKHPTQEKGKQEEDKGCKKKKEQNNNDNNKAYNKCALDDSDVDELHRECVHLSKDELIVICNKYKFYDKKFPIKRDKSDTVTTAGKRDSKGTNDSVNKKKHNCKEIEENDEYAEEKTEDGEKCLYDNDENGDDDEHQEEKEEEEDDDDDRYYGIERPFKNVPVVEESAKEVKKTPPETALRDYRCYDMKTPEEKQKNIFLKSTLKYSQTGRELDTYTHSKPESKKSRKLSSSSGSNLTCNSEVLYYDENLNQEKPIKKKSEKSTKKIDSCKEVNVAKDNTFYFDKNCNNTLEVNNGDSSIRDAGKCYDPNCNNNNPVDTVEEKSDYYEHNDEGINMDESCESNYSDVRGSGDYTGYCFGRQEGGDDRENKERLRLVGRNVSKAKKEDPINSSYEIYHEYSEPSCPVKPAGEQSYHCGVKSQVKYNTVGICSIDKSDDSYFHSSEQIPRELQHLKSTFPNTFSKGPKFTELLFQEAEPNYFSLDTADAATQPHKIYNLMGAPNESDMTPSLTSFNFEQYKRVFESMKQRAFEEDFGDFFETRSPDINESFQTNKSARGKPQIVLGDPETGGTFNRKADFKKSGLLRSIIGIITTSGTKLTQKTAKGNTKPDYENLQEEVSNKSKLTDKKYFNFGRHKVKSADKYIDTDNFIITKKIKTKPKLRFGKTVILSSRKKVLNTTVNNIEDGCSKCRIVDVEYADDSPVKTIDNKVESDEERYMNAVTNIMESAKNSCQGIVKNIIESVDNISIDKVKSIVESVSNSGNEAVKNIVESMSNSRIGEVKNIVESMSNSRIGDVKNTVESVSNSENEAVKNIVESAGNSRIGHFKNMVESVSNSRIGDVKNMVESVSNSRTGDIKNMVESVDNRIISKFLDERELEVDEVYHLEKNNIDQMVNKDITFSSDSTCKRTSHASDATQPNAAESVCSRAGLVSDCLSTDTSVSKDKSNVEDGSIFEENNNNKEIDEILNKQAPPESTLGVIFTATLDDGSNSEFENRHVLLLNSRNDVKQPRLLNESNKASLVNTISEFCEKIECSDSDSALTMNGYQGNFRPFNQSRDSNETSRSFQENDIFFSTLTSLTATNEIMKQVDTTTLDANAFDNAQPRPVANRTHNDKVNPFYKVNQRNKLKVHEVSSEPKLLTKTKENLKCIKNHREKQMKTNTKESTNVAKKRQFCYRKINKSKTDLTKTSIVDSALKLTTSNLATVIETPYLTSGSVENFKKSNLLVNDFVSPSLLANHITGSEGKETDTKYRSKSTGMGYCHERNISGNINKHESELQNNVTNSSGRKKSANLETKTRAVSCFVNNSANKNRVRYDGKNVSPSYKSAMTGLFNQKSCISTFKSLNIHTSANKLYLNQKPALKAKSRNPFKNRSFNQARVPEVSKSAYIFSRKEIAKKVTKIVHDNENKNVNCGCDEDDPTSCKLQNLSNGFINNHEPLQNICDIHEISAIPEVQAMVSHEVAGSNIIMGSFILEGPANSDIASNLVSYEHPSLRNRAVCRLDELQDRVNPQSDMFVPNTQESLSRNDTFHVELSDNMMKSVIRDDEALRDVKLKTFPFLESNIDADKCLPYKVEDGNISLVQSYIGKSEVPGQKQHIGHIGGKFHDAGNIHLDSQTSRFEGRREVVPATQPVKNREEKDKRCFVKFSKFRNIDSDFVDKEEKEMIDRYAKYNVLEKINETESFKDSQMLKRRNAGSTLPEYGQYNNLKNEDIQFFFGCPYTTSASYGHSTLAEAGEADNEKGNVYTTGRIYAANAAESTSNDYIENNPSSRRNNGAMWTNSGYLHYDNEEKGSMYSGNDVMYSGGKSPGKSWTVDDYTHENKTEASKEANCWTNTKYSSAWKMSDANKAKDDVLDNNQFWSKTFSSPLSKDERIWKMADAILDRKVEEINEKDCWSDKVFSPITKGGATWKMENTIMKTKGGNNIEKNDSPKTSPQRSSERTGNINETINEKKDESVNNKGLSISKVSSPSRGEGKGWAAGGLITEKKSSGKKAEDNLVKTAGSAENVTSFQGKGDHEIKAVPRNDIFRKGSDLVPTLTARTFLTTDEKRLRDSKLQSKADVNCKDNLHGDSLHVGAKVSNIADVKSKEKGRKDYNTKGNIVGNSKVNGNESAVTTPQVMQSHKGILSSSRNKEGDTAGKVNQIISPKTKNKIEARDKHDLSITSLHTRPEHGKEQLNIARKEISPKHDEETWGQKRKLDSPTKNIWNDTNDKEEHGVASVPNKNMQEQSNERQSKGKQSYKKKDKISGDNKKKNKDNNTTGDKITESGSERQEPISFKVSRKLESSGRQGYLLVPTFPQSVPEFTSEQISTRKHKNDKKEKTDYGKSKDLITSKKDKRSESGGRYEYVINSHMKAEGKNVEQLKRNESFVRKEKTLDVLTGELTQGNCKDNVISRQGYTSTHNAGRNAVDHRVESFLTGKDVNWREKQEIGVFKESTPPRKSMDFESRDRHDYTIITSMNKKKSSPSVEQQFATNDNIGRKDMADGVRGDKDVTYLRVNNQMGRAGLATNINFNKRESSQLLVQNHKEEETKRKRESIKLEAENYVAAVNATKATQNNGNISHIRKQTENNHIGQISTTIGNISARGKMGKEVTNQGKEISLNKANIYKESKVRPGYSINAEKRIEQAHVNERNGHGNEKLTKSRHEATLSPISANKETRSKNKNETILNEGKLILEYTLEETDISKDIYKKKNCNAEVMTKQRKVINSPTENSKTNKQGFACILNTDKKMLHQQGAGNEIIKVEYNVGDGIISGQEKTTPRIKSDILSKPNYYQTNAHINLPSNTEMPQIVSTVSNGKAETGAGEDMYQGKEMISPTVTVKSEFKSVPNYAKSYNFDKNMPSHKFLKQQLSKENGSTTQNETHEAVRNAHETWSPKTNKIESKFRQEFAIISNQSKAATGQTHMQINTLNENGGRRDKKYDENNQRHEMNSKVNLSNDLTGRQTALPSKNIPYQQVVKPNPTKDSYQREEKYIEEAKQVNHDFAPTLEAKGGVNIGPSYLQTSFTNKIPPHQKVEPARVSDVRAHLNDKTTNTALVQKKENAITRGNIKYDVMNRQGFSASPNVRKNTLSYKGEQPCTTEDSDATIEKKVNQVNKSMSPNGSSTMESRRSEINAFLAGLSISDHNLDEPYISKDEIDSNEAMTGEMTVREKDFFLKDDSKMKHASTYYKSDYMLDTLPSRIQIEACSFENTFSDPLVNNIESVNGCREAFNTDLSLADAKQVQGYGWHQSASRSKTSLSKANEAAELSQLETERGDLNSNISKTFCEDYPVKCDHSLKASCFIEDPIDAPLHENHQCMSETSTIKSKISFSPRSYLTCVEKAIEKTENITHVETDKIQAVYDKKNSNTRIENTELSRKYDSVSNVNLDENMSGNERTKVVSANYKQVTAVSNKDSEERIISSRSDLFKHQHEISERSDIFSMVTTKANIAEVPRKQKPLRIFKIDYEENISDKIRYKATKNINNQRVNVQEITDIVKNSKKIESKPANQQNGDKEKTNNKSNDRNKQKQIIPEYEKKVVADNQKRRAENSKLELFSTKDVHASKETTKKVNHISDGEYKKLNHLHLKEAGKKWKTEIHRKKKKNETEKAFDGKKLNLSSSFGEKGRQGEDFKKKNVEKKSSITGEMKTEQNKLRNIRENARQELLKKAIGKISPHLNTTALKNELEASNRTVQKHETEPINLTLSEKLRRNQRSAKKSLTETNQTDRYSSSLIDSSLVDNVARAWLEDARNVNNLKEPRAFYPSFLNKPLPVGSVSVVNNTHGARSKKESRRQSSPMKKGDYLDIFPHPTFLHISTRKENDELLDLRSDYANKTSNHSKSGHLRSRKRNDEDAINLGEITGGKLVTPLREVKKDMNNERSKISKSLYESLQNLIPQTVSMNTRPFFNHLEGGKPGDFRKNMTKDDSFIHHGYAYKDTTQTARSRSGDKPTARYNRLDGVTSEKSYLINDHRKAGQASNYLSEDRSKMKTYREGFDKAHTTQEQRNIELKSDKASHDTKSTTENIKGTRTATKSTKTITTTHEAANGVKAASDNHKSKRNSSPRTKTPLKAGKISDIASVSKIRSENQIARGQMFCYKVSSKGSRSEIVKATPKGAQSEIKIENQNPECTTIIPKVEPKLEIAIEVPKEVVNETKIVVAEPVAEPAPLGLFARLFNSLTRSSKLTTVQAVENVAKPEQKEGSIAKPGECTKEQGKSEGALCGKEKAEVNKNKPLRNRSPYMSIREARKLRSDYKQNVNSNADYEVNMDAVPECVEPWVDVIKKRENCEDRANCKMNETHVSRNLSRSVFGISEWNIALLVLIFMIATDTCCISEKIKRCPQCPLPSVYGLLYKRGLSCVAVHAFLIMKITAKNVWSSGIKTLSKEILRDFATSMFSVSVYAAVLIFTFFNGRFFRLHNGAIIKLVRRLHRKTVSVFNSMVRPDASSQAQSLVLDVNSDEICPADLSQIRKSHSRHEKGSLVFYLNLDRPAAAYDVSNLRKP